MRRVLFRVAFVVAVVMCATATSLWAWSQWTFARVTCSYARDASDPFRQRQLVFLMWRDAAEVIVRNEVYHPDDEAARARLRLDLPRERHVDIYHQRGVSTSEDGDQDVAGHWGFWCRSPEASRRMDLAGSRTKAVGDGMYDCTREDERALFLPWWFLVALFGAFPLIVMTRRLRRALRAWGGRCVMCGYDVRYTTGRCPECGTAIMSNARMSAP